MDTPTAINWTNTRNYSFLKQQLQYPRVREAVKNTELQISTLLQDKGINRLHFDLYLRAFKKEAVLEVWAKSRNEEPYRLLTTYPFCKNSGILGPKRKEGDRQIPEGFYQISHYNPKSSFHLSLKVNYPNASDLILSDPQQPGSDIYIHGDCQTVGCIPLTDQKIEELYFLSVLGKSQNDSIPIHILPFKMNEENFEKNIAHFSQHQTFWKALQTGYDFFEKERRIPEVSVDDDGQYLINNVN